MTAPGDSTGGGRTGRPSDRRPRPRPIALDVVREDGDWKAFAPVKRTVDAAAGALADLPEMAGVRGTATLVLSSDARIRLLNKSWRGKDKATNVLSFPAAGGQSPGRRRPFLGDIVLAAETLVAEAARDGIPPRHHLQHLVIHGLLHLAGHDHETDPEAEVMEALETRALASLGVADPYETTR